MTSKTRGKRAPYAGKQRPADKILRPGAVLLKKRRESDGDTLASAAQKLECDPTVLCRVESSDRPPSLDFARHLFDRFGIPMDSWHPPGWKWKRPLIGEKRKRSAA